MFRWTLVFTATLLTAPLLAFADQAAPSVTPPLQQFVSQAITLFFAAVSPVLTYYVVHFFRSTAKKAKVQLSAAQEKHITTLVERSIDYVEEQTHKAAKSGIAAMSDEAKLRLAMQHAEEWIKKSRLPKLNAKDLSKRVEAHLNGMR